MTKINSNFTVVSSGTERAINVLKSRFNYIGNDELEKVKSVKVVEGELKDKKDYEFDKENLVLRVTKGNIDVIEAIRKDLKTSDYVPEEILQDKKGQLQLDPEKEKSQASLGVVSEILDRAYNRRTTLTSWILCFALRSFGFTEMDNFTPVAEILQKNDFISKFTDYKKLAEKSKDKANEFLKTTCSEDKENGDKKQNLVKIASFLIDNYNKLNMSFVTWFPIVFGIQNVVMPWLKALLPKVKLFDFMVTVNPWLSEVSENIGNYAGEIKDIQEIEKGINKEKVISEVKFTPLKFKAFLFQNIMKHIHNGAKRVFGKRSTPSALIIDKWLECNRGKAFEAYSEEFVNETAEGGFVREFYDGLEKIKPGDSAWDVPEKKFNDNGDKRWISRFILYITSFARSVTPEWVKKSTNTFGAIFVPLNLTMPLIAKVFHKGFLGFVTHSLLKLFPLANELFFDHLGNFRKEILDVQKEMKKESMAELFPQINAHSKLELLTSTFKNLYNSIKGFAGRKNPATAS